MTTRVGGPAGRRLAWASCPWQRLSPFSSRFCGRRERPAGKRDRRAFEGRCRPRHRCRSERRGEGAARGRDRARRDQVRCELDEPLRRDRGQGLRPDRLPRRRGRPRPRRQGGQGRRHPRRQRRSRSLDLGRSPQRQQRRERPPHRRSRRGPLGLEPPRLRRRRSDEGRRGEPVHADVRDQRHRLPLQEPDVRRPRHHRRHRRHRRRRRPAGAPDGPRPQGQDGPEDRRLDDDDDPPCVQRQQP